MATSTETSTVKVSEIEVPEGFNPRREFDETALEQLAASIKKNGITTALTVARENGHFVLIDGERRLRAAKKAGVKEVPVLVREDENALAAALVANVQREDLNPIEEAEALRRLSEVEGLGTHKALAEQVGKPVPFVSKRLRLLALPKGCHAGIASGEIPLAAEPQLRAIAQASPEVAVAACELALSEDAEASDLVDRPGDILRALCVREGAPFVRDVSNGVTIRDLVADAERRGAGDPAGADGRFEPDSHYADHLHFRAGGGRRRSPSGLRQADRIPERLGFRLRSALPGRRRAGRRSGGAGGRAGRAAVEKAAKQKAKEAGVEVDGQAPATDQLREAERAERARSARRQARGGEGGGPKRRARRGAGQAPGRPEPQGPPPEPGEGAGSAGDRRQRRAGGSRAAAGDAAAA